MTNKYTRFSLATIIVEDYDTGDILGEPLVQTASLEVPLGREVITTMGGASQWNNSGRNARVDGDAKLMINDCPPFLGAASIGAEYVENDAPNLATITGSDVVGATVVAAINVAQASNVKAQAGTLFVEYLGSGSSVQDSAKIRVSGGGPLGGFNIELDDVTSAARTIDKLGVAVSFDDTATTPSAGDTAKWVIDPQNRTRVITAGSTLRSKYYSIKAWTYANDADVVEDITIAKIMFSGSTWTATDNEAATGTEFGFKMFDPGDGTAPFVCKQIAL